MPVYDDLSARLCRHVIWGAGPASHVAWFAAMSASRVLPKF
jgi:hypothetical protein